VVKSSNGNGTRTTLPFIAEGLTVIAGINVLGRIIQEIDPRIPRRSVQPFLLINIHVVRYKEQYTNPARPDYRNGLIQMQYTLLIQYPGYFNRSHHRFHDRPPRIARSYVRMKTFCMHFIIPLAAVAHCITVPHGRPAARRGRGGVPP
ncbi:MAG: hypothetical protein M3008_08040, partial [Chloroflexota bacterium]|nr:hypothetical protein [Chloroflexota bacterium]